MRTALGATVDRRLAELITVRLRRAWPLLTLLPAACIVPVVVPAARNLRRSLLRTVIAAAVFAGAMIVIVAVLT